MKAIEGGMNFIDVCKSWALYLSSLTIGGMGVLELLDKWMNLAFTTIGTVGLVVSIIYNLRRIKEMVDNGKERKKK